MTSQWQLPGYAVERLVGFGPHGDVWQARESATGTRVALKRLAAAGDDVRSGLRRHAAVLGSLGAGGGAAHVVAVRDVLRYDGDPPALVVVTDFVAGGDLTAVFERRGRLAVPEVVTLVGPLARALADLHARGLVHGHLTASNVVFGPDGRPMLTDAGLAVALGAEPAPADDVRALAVLAHTALAGSGASGLPPGVPAALAQALAAACADDPATRPDAASFADAVLGSSPAAPIGLARAAEGPRPAPMPPPTRPVARRRPRPRRRPARIRGPVALAAAVGLAVTVGAAWGRHASAPVAALPSRPPVTQPWRDVVARLDALRAAAFRAADPHLLDAVYAPGAPALAADRDTVRSLAARGLRARGFDAAVSEVTRVNADATSATLRVVDALTGYDLVDAAGHVVGHGPARPPRAFVLVLTRVGGSWRVASVHP